MGFAATEVGLQLDHRIAALAIEPLQGATQQVAHAGGDESAAVELNRIGVFGGPEPATHLIEVGGELGLLVFTGDHIRVGVITSRQGTRPALVWLSVVA